MLLASTTDTKSVSNEVVVVAVAGFQGHCHGHCQGFGRGCGGRGYSGDYSGGVGHGGHGGRYQMWQTYQDYLKQKMVNGVDISDVTCGFTGDEWNKLPMSCTM